MKECPMTTPSDGREERMLDAFARLTTVQQERLIGIAELLGSKPVDDGPGTRSTTITDPGTRAGPETVIGALKRLRRSYPDLDRRSLMGEASALVAEHALHGGPATEVIGRLEHLFERHAAAAVRHQV